MKVCNFKQSRRVNCRDTRINIGRCLGYRLRLETLPQPIESYQATRNRLKMQANGYAGDSMFERWVLRIRVSFSLFDLANLTLLLSLRWMAKPICLTNILGCYDCVDILWTLNPSHPNGTLTLDPPASIRAQLTWLLNVTSFDNLSGTATDRQARDVWRKIYRE